MANFIGTPGNDNFDGTGGNDSALGGDGNDTLHGSGGQDVLDGGNGDDALDGEGGGDVLIGGAGNDTLYGSAGVDRLYGGDGNDILSMPASGGVVDGGNGIDELGSISFYGAKSDILIDLRAAATSTGTVINGATVQNIEIVRGVYTGDGNDTVVIDAVDGRYNWFAGLGDDMLVISLATATTAVHSVFNALNGGDYDLRTDAGDIEFKMYSYSTRAGDRLDITGGLNDDVLIGLDRDDILRGGNGRDSLAGQGGDDTLDGGTNTDSMVGGGGNDVYYVDNIGDEVSELVGQGADTVFATVSFNMGTAEIETVILTGDSDINVTGNAGVNSLTGNSGNNIMDGGAYIDTLAGMAGNDTYIVDNSLDSVIEFAGHGTDIVFASASFALLGYVENLTLTGSAHIDARGNALDNMLTGNSGNNVISGGLGADTMVGGAGNDTYSVENASDQVIELSGQGTDTIMSSITCTLGANVENLILNGDDYINGYGNALSNIIYGNSRGNSLDAGTGGSDVLIGRAGDDSYVIDHAGVTAVERTGEGVDTVYALVNFALGDNVENLYLDGGALNGRGNGLDNVVVGNALNNHLSGEGGNDTLTGGGGQDVFVFGLGSGADVISDFSVIDHDRINVNAYSHGTSGGGGITVTQSGLDVVIDMGGGNMITVLNSLSSAVYAHIFW